jgi:hypothetical protein
MRQQSTRLEQGWALLAAFVAASLLLHAIAFYSSRGWSIFGPKVAATRPGEIEISLAPLPVTASKTESKSQTPAAPKPITQAPPPKINSVAPVKPLIPERQNDIPVPFAPKPVAKIRGVAPKDAEKPVSKTETSTETVEVPQPSPFPVPNIQPRELAGGKFPDRDLTPLPLGINTGDPDLAPLQQPKVLRNRPQDIKPLGPQDMKSGSGAAPGQRPTELAKNPDAEPIPTGKSGTTSGSGNPAGSSTGNSGDEGGSGAGLRRGLPFGDPSGIVGGDPNGGGGKGGGPGGPGTGDKYGGQRGGGAGAPVHVVYILDISDSMNDDRKIDKAKQALKQALEELTPQDTFNIVYFFTDAYRFSKQMEPATPEAIKTGEKFVDSLKARGSTNYSGALTLALALPDITHVVLMSDGLPTIGVGVDDYTMELKGAELLKWIRYQNVSRAHILTIGLGIGQKWDGIDLLRDIASENKGTFRYIDMKKF